MTHRPLSVTRSGRLAGCESTTGPMGKVVCADIMQDLGVSRTTGATMQRRALQRQRASTSVRAKSSPLNSNAAP